MPEESFLEKILKVMVWLGAIGSFFIPWIIGNGGFFPFVGPKSLWFIFAAQWMFFSWLALAIINPKYRPTKNPILLVLLVYVLVVGLATIFGVDPARSFWSKFERMTGCLMIIHCVMYFIALSSFFRTKKQWTILLLTSVFLSLLMGFAFLGFKHSETLVSAITAQDPQIQQQQLLTKLGWPWGDLYAAYVNGQNGLSLGNKSFMGTYLMFNAFFALYLLMVAIFDKARLGLEKISNSQFWRNFVIGLSGSTLAILVLVLKMANARAMFYSFLGGAALFLIFAFSKKVNKNIGRISLAIFAILALLFLVSIIYKDSPINKIYNINEVFVKSGGGARLVIWQDMVPQILKKPILGWGPENFELAFYPVFDPKLFLPENGGEIWFDRAHNVFVDNVISTGFLGLAAYLAIFAVVVWFLYRESKKEEGDYWAFATMVPLMAAYFVQNATVFDMVSSFLVFFFALAFITSARKYEEKDVVLREAPINKQIGLVLVAITFILFCFVFVIKGFEANVGVIDVIFSYSAYDNMPTYCKLANLKRSVLTPEQVRFMAEFRKTAESLIKVYGPCDQYQYRNKFEDKDFQARKKYFLESVSAGRYGIYQNRDFLADIYITNISGFDRTAVEAALKDKDPVMMKNILTGLKNECDFWIGELQKSSQESPQDYRAFLKLGYSAAFCARNTGRSEYLNISKQALLKAQEISPKNPNTFWYMSQALVFEGKREEAAKWLKDALALNDSVVMSYQYLIQFYAMAGDFNAAKGYANQAIAKFEENAQKSINRKEYWLTEGEKMKQALLQIATSTPAKAVKN